MNLINISVGVAANAIPSIVSQQAELIADLTANQDLLGHELIRSEMVLADTRDELEAMKTELRAVRASLSDLDQFRAQIARLSEMVEVQTAVSN